jgi:hypothetical protein
MPLPSNDRLLWPSARWNRSKSRGTSASGIPPRVADRQLRTALGRGEPDFDAAFEGELEGVGDQVENDLLPHAAVDVDRLGKRVAGDVQPKAGPLAGGTKVRHQLRGHPCKVRRLIGYLRAAGFDAGEVQQDIHEPEQAQAVTMSQGHKRPPVGGKPAFRLGQKFLERTHHQRERRPELVADVGEERGLGAVGLGQRLRPPVLVLEGVRLRDGRCDVAGHELEEVPVAGIQLAARAGAGDEEAGRSRPARRRKGKHDGRLDGIRPKGGGEGADPVGQIAHLDRFLRPHHLGDRPRPVGADPGQVEHGGKRHRVVGQPGRGDAAGHLAILIQ